MRPCRLSVAGGCASTGQCPCPARGCGAGCNPRGHPELDRGPRRGCCIDCGCPRHREGPVAPGMNGSRGADNGVWAVGGFDDTTAAATDTVNRRWFRRPRAIVLFVLCSVVTLVLLGVGVFKSSGHVAFDQAAALGEAVTSDPAALYDQTQIAAKAEALGATVSFSPDFAEDGQVVVHSWIPQASVCLYLPATVPWGLVIRDEPCEDGPRDGPAAFPADERAAFGISEPQSWADADNPLIAVGSGSQATGYGDVYVQNQGPNNESRSPSPGSTR